MTIADTDVSKATIEATHRSNRRSSGKSPEAVTALAGRIRALQRSEPHVIGHERIATLAELNLLQLQLERIALAASNTNADHTKVLADTFALAQQVDRLARLWPSDAAGNVAMADAHRPRPHGQKAA